ncbi:MAG TPA: hypothetical protein VFE27_19075 [Acidobacteriaceae bacterium]|jgi:hypothetical protein|nr:hypothetical protein [Acidobacteriaceae bacterium]
MNVQQNLHQVRPPQAGGKVFGIPLGDLGLFTSVLMALTLGFLSFFLFTFLAIAGLVIYNGMGHHVDLADSYKYFSFPAGCVVLLISLIFFGTLWLRRKVSGG